MVSFVNRTVFDIPSTWNRTCFKTTRSKCRRAQKLIQRSINVQFERQLKNIHSQNLDLEKKITETNERLSKHEKQVNIFDNLTEIASESLPTHFDKRMKSIQTTIEEHCRAIQTIFQNENQYWKDIQSTIDQNSKSKPHSTLLPSINKTYLTKLDEITNRLSSVESYPTYSQPNSPIPLYFSPTILQDKQTENIRNTFSPVKQIQTSKSLSPELMKPRIIIRRIDPVLLEYFKNQENNSQNSFALPETKSKSIPRKRKKSISQDNDIKSRAIKLRRRKSVSIIEINDETPKTRHNRKVKKEKISIRESSSLPMIGRSKHYHTRFSTRR